MNATEGEPQAGNVEMQSNINFGEVPLLVCVGWMESRSGELLVQSLSEGRPPLLECFAVNAV
jgi:hypothetical protein